MRLLLIDANSLIHRAFHALPPLTTINGSPGQALYGLGSIMLKLWREQKPDYAAALFDRPEPTFRKEKYSEYKAQRPAAPNELVSQIIEAKNLFQKFGVNFFEAPGFEADDLIATFARKFEGVEELEIVILTGDMDTLQLVNDKVSVQTLRKGVSDTMTYNEAAVREKYGLTPPYLIEYKALVGDASDNIRGVSGIGPKTAAELVQKYGSLESIFEHLSELAPGVRDKLARGHEEAFLSRTLLRLSDNAPVPPTELESLRVGEDKTKAAEYLESLGFASLVQRLMKAEEPAVKKLTQGKIF